MLYCTGTYNEMWASHCPHGDGTWPEPVATVERSTPSRRNSAGMRKIIYESAEELYRIRDSETTRIHTRSARS